MSFIIGAITEFLQKFFLGNYRKKRISKQLSFIISRFTKKKNIKILDYGSGFFKPSISQFLKEDLKKKKIKCQILCLDLYSKMDIQRLQKNSDIKFFNVNYLDLNINKNTYDFSIISDTLHHMDVDKLEELSILLKKIKKISNFLIIKDHYEYGFFSRKVLQILDFFGNFHNKTYIPKKYFTLSSFQKLIQKSNLTCAYRMYNKFYYPKFFLFFSNAKLHFIYLLK